MTILEICTTYCSMLVLLYIQPLYTVRELLHHSLTVYDCQQGVNDNDDYNCNDDDDFDHYLDHDDDINDNIDT